MSFTLDDIDAISDDNIEQFLLEGGVNTSHNDIIRNRRTVANILHNNNMLDESDVLLHLYNNIDDSQTSTLLSDVGINNTNNLTKREALLLLHIIYCGNNTTNDNTNKLAKVLNDDQIRVLSTINNNSCVNELLSNVGNDKIIVLLDSDASYQVWRTIVNKAINDDDIKDM